jgi:ABC-type phosphate transport system substrate-binding protein
MVQEFAKVCDKTTDKNGMEQIDFAGSDSLLKASEYSAYPDLQMFPSVFGLPHVKSHHSMQLNPWMQAICELAASEERYDSSRNLTENPNQVAGGIVPVYNLPVLDQNKPEEALVLDRLTLAYIFIGNITQWNDQRILGLQSPTVRAKLADAAEVINVIVRKDASGSTEVLTKALDL